MKFFVWIISIVEVLKQFAFLIRKSVLYFYFLFFFLHGVESKNSKSLIGKKKKKKKDLDQAWHK